MQWGSKARGMVGTLVGNLKAYASLHATTAIARPSSFEDTNRITNCLRGNPGIAVGIARDCIPSPCIRLKLTRYSLPLKERIVAIECSTTIGVGQGRHGACVDSQSRSHSSNLSIDSGRNRRGWLCVLVRCVRCMMHLYRHKTHVPRSRH